MTKVRFTLPASNIIGATECILVGEFNNWNPQEGILLKKEEDGSMNAEVELPTGDYQYRYLLSNGRWVNDEGEKITSDLYGYPVENCIVRVAETAIVTKPVAKKAKAVKTKTAPKAKKEAAKDDLTKIEGIGKKIESLLNKSDILSYKQLAKSTAKKLKQVLDEAGSKFSMHNPASWPKQAKLAADGNWDELEALQEKLKGGK
ncbi:MAG TPA: glycoside hydrolase family 13 [Ferruginibacter sp.]|nr:glycoside hydrolase family 13 [Chitinophagaceae bacterium]HRI24421.1 glycoside hydrolase family 13 [Ferruginibacter sp.]